MFKNNDAPSSMILPRVRGGKGLPLHFDVEAFISQNPGGNTRFIGAAAKYTISPGDVLFPDVAVRAHGTLLQGVSDLNLRTYGADVSVGKELGFEVPGKITPYVGYS